MTANEVGLVTEQQERLNRLLLLEDGTFFNIKKIVYRAKLSRQ